MNYRDNFGDIVAILSEKYGVAIAEGTHFVRSSVLQERLNVLNMKQQGVQKKSHVNQSTISRMKTGASDSGARLRFEAAAIYAVAVALECEFEQLAILPEGYASYFTASQIDAARDKLQEVAMVRTLLCPKSPSDVRSFYFRTIVRECSETTRQSFELADLSLITPGLTIVEGHAGRGKSMLLRYLAAEAALSGEIVPVFIELRRLRETSLRHGVLAYLQSVGLPVSDNDFETLLSSGQVVLMLDAFDEVLREDRPKLTNEIEFLTTRCFKLKVLATSRPNEWTMLSEPTSTLQIQPIRKQDICKVASKYLDGPTESALAEELRGKIDDSVSDVLDTPLMILLMVLHFQFTGIVPQSVTNFYRDLFDVMLRRHNLSESGVKRRVRSGLGSDQLRTAFAGFCYESGLFLEGKGVWRFEAENSIARVLKAASLNTSASAVLDDFHELVCLVTEESGRFFFVHRTIHEFFTAEHVASFSDVESRAFYRNFLTDFENKSKLFGIFNFLRQVDSYRFYRFWAIARIEHLHPFSVEAIVTRIVHVRLCMGDSGCQALILELVDPLGEVSILSFPLRPPVSMPILELSEFREQLAQIFMFTGEKIDIEGSVKRYEQLQIQGAVLQQVIRMPNPPSAFECVLKELEIWGQFLKQSHAKFRREMERARVKAQSSSWLN